MFRAKPSVNVIVVQLLVDLRSCHFGVHRSKIADVRKYFCTVLQEVRTFFHVSRQKSVSTRVITWSFRGERNRCLCDCELRRVDCQNEMKPAEICWKKLQAIAANGSLASANSVDVA
jgi:hypothetical protein